MIRWILNLFRRLKPARSIPKQLFPIEENEALGETMDLVETDRIKYILSFASCKLLSGLKRRLNNAKLNDLRLLCRFFNCSVDDLAERAWRYKKMKPLRKGIK